MDATVEELRQAMEHFDEVVSMLPPVDCPRAARVLPAYCPRTACVLLAYRLRTARVLPAYCSRTACVPPEYRPRAALGVGMG